MSERAVQVRITGIVQGVGYRWSCQVQASTLGVHGWVRNDHDGSVTGHFEGPPEAVQALIDWCRQGPPGARVSDVQVSDASAEGLTRFTVQG